MGHLRRVKKSMLKASGIRAKSLRGIVGEFLLKIVKKKGPSKMAKKTVKKPVAKPGKPGGKSGGKGC